MASPAIDYDALAKQHGAVSSTPAGAAPVDYDALAKQHGATSSTSAAPSLLQDIGTSFRNFGRDVGSSVYGAAATANKIFANLSDIGENVVRSTVGNDAAAPLHNVGQTFRQNQLAQQTEAQRLAGGRNDLASQINRGLTQGVLELPQYAVAAHVAGPVAGMAAIGGISEADKGWWAAMQAAAEGALTGGALHVMGPASQALRAFGAAGMTYVQARLNGADPQTALTHATTMGIFAGHSPGGVTAREFVPGLDTAIKTGERVAEATGAGARAAGPDVGMGTAKAAGGYAAGELASMVPGGGFVRHVLDIPTALVGGRQIGRGLKKGYQAARTSWAETAPPEAPQASETAAPGPAGAPTDDAVLHLYSVETDPAKRAALRTELIDRGLMNDPDAPAAPGENPYRGYTQTALRNVYAPAPAEPAPAARPAAAEIAAQLEAESRPDRMLDFLRRMDPEITADALDSIAPHEWAMVAEGAGSPRGTAPTAEDIATIRGNLGGITATEPAAAAAEFEQKRTARTRKPPAPPADVEAQLADSLAAVKKGERPVAEAPPETPRAATASDKRVEAYAQHFAADPGTAIADIEPLTKLPDFPKLGRALEIDGALAPGEAARIAARVKELRGGDSTAPAEAAAPPAIIEPDVQSTPTIGSPTGEQSGSSGQAVRGSREPTNPVARGSAATVRVPGQKTGYEGQYSVRELDDVHASHNPHTFEKNPNYQLRNDRDYSNPVNKERIVVNSKGDTFDPAYLMDSPDATNGAPVIDADGNVIGGNSRAMVLDRVYKYNQAGADAYKAELARKAPQLGIDPEQIAGMKRPVLVRELSDAGLNKQRAITDLNKTGTAALTAEEQATADARMMTPAAADYLSSVIDAEGADVTLSDVLSSNRGPAIVNRLIDDGVFTMQERPKLINEKTKVVTPAGKERISKMLLGQAFEESDQMGRTPAEIKNKLERAVSPIMQSSQKRGFDIRPTVREALDVLEQARMHDVTQMRDLISQEGMFPGAPKFSEQAIDLAQFIQDSKPTAIGQAFRRYVANADPTFFGESTPAEAFADAFGTTAPPATLRDLMQPKAAEPPAAAAPRKRRSKPVR